MRRRAGARARSAARLPAAPRTSVGPAIEEIGASMTTGHSRRAVWRHLAVPSSQRERVSTRAGRRPGSRSSRRGGTVMRVRARRVIHEAERGQHVAHRPRLSDPRGGARGPVRSHAPGRPRRSDLSCSTSRCGSAADVLDHAIVALEPVAKRRRARGSRTLLARATTSSLRRGWPFGLRRVPDDLALEAGELGDELARARGSRSPRRCRGSPARAPS